MIGKRQLNKLKRNEKNKYLLALSTTPTNNENIENINTESNFNETVEDESMNEKKNT